MQNDFDMRLVQISNKAAPSEIISAVSVQRTKWIVNQLGVRAAYIDSPTLYSVLYQNIKIVYLPR